MMKKIRDNCSVKLMNVKFSTDTFDYIFLKMEDGIINKTSNYICITNTESLYHATNMSEHFKYINNATFSCCDGIGVVIAGRLLGQKIPRLHGPDLMLKCCEYGVKKKWRHFFYGGKESVPETLERKLIEKFPGLLVAGFYSPPFRELTEDEDTQVVQMINDANPDIVWVGLGLLKQEKWVADHIDRLNVSWLVGVGAAFDFHAGTVKRAPEFYQKIGLEWLYRVAFEPRMIRRIFLSLKALLMIIWKAFKTKANVF